MKPRRSAFLLLLRREIFERIDIRASPARASRFEDGLDLASVRSSASLVDLGLKVKK
jgi:hypothetical protein